MSDFSPYFGFAVVSFMMAASPGPSWVYTVSTTLSYNRTYGMYGNAGNSTGILFHAVASVVGLSALITYSTFAFNCLKFIGAAYLVYLGICAFLGKGTFSVKTEKHQRNYWQIFRDGALVNILNPKMSLLFLALLPQFISTSTTDPRFQIAVMGIMHAVIAFIVHTHVIFFSGLAANYLKSSGKSKKLVQNLVGCLFISFGIKLALFTRD